MFSFLTDARQRRDATIKWDNRILGLGNLLKVITLANCYKASAPASEHILVIAAKAALAGVLYVRCNVITASLFICKAAPGDETTDFMWIYGMLYLHMPCGSTSEMDCFLFKRLEAKMHVLSLTVVSTNDRAPEKRPSKPLYYEPTVEFRWSPLRQEFLCGLNKIRNRILSLLAGWEAV